jgi:hypothetical protein
MPRVIMTDTVTEHRNRIKEENSKIGIGFVLFITGFIFIGFAIKLEQILKELSTFLGAIGFLMIIFSVFYIWLVKDSWKKEKKVYRYD